MQHITLLSTNTMHALAHDICVQLGLLGIACEHQKFYEVSFPDQEVWAQAPTSVRNRDVYLIHSLRWPDPNTALIEYGLIVDLLKRASVGNIHAVLPYLPYMRQDRKDKGRVPISARYIAELIEHRGAVRHTITFDLHADQEQGFFDWAVDVLRGDVLLAAHYHTLLGQDVRHTIVVAPDVGASKRAQRFARRLNDAPLAIIDKRRNGPGDTSITHFIGPPRLDGMHAILFDDLCDSGGTLATAAELLYTRGASSVHAAVTHGLLTNQAEERLSAARVQLALLETIPRTTGYKEAHLNITFLPIGAFLANVIAQNTLPEGSVSKLLE